MKNVPINKNIINLILFTPSYKSFPEHNNNINEETNLLLNWLSFFFPDKLIDENWREDLRNQNVSVKINYPISRIENSIEICLKDEINQIEFVRIYNKSINENFNWFFDRLNRLCIKEEKENISFLEYYYLIKVILDYYNVYLKYLNFNPTSKNLFVRNLNFLFHSNLLTKQKELCFLKNKKNDSDFILKTKSFLDQILFKNNFEKQNSENILSFSHIVQLFTTIDMSNELNQILISLSINEIKKYIHDNCLFVWNIPVIESINQYVFDKIYPNFLVLINCYQKKNLLNEDNTHYLHELIKIAHDELITLRLKEIYQIVQAYPSSMNTLRELYNCILFNLNINKDKMDDRIDKSKIDLYDKNLSFKNHSYLINYSLKFQAFQRAKIVETFIKYCEKNLLHSGSNTTEVIILYIKTIKSFLVIDPKGVLLDKVVRPIRKYLKTREDIIIKLVHGLLDDNEKTNQLIELAFELRNADMFYVQDPVNNNHNSLKRNLYIEDLVDLNWTPDPIDALSDFKKGKSTDIIESLISIFNSKEIFIHEFTKFFGEILLTIHKNSLDEINNHLDMLKLRFGKKEFITLDIMIKDINDSVLINNQLEKILVKNDYKNENIKFYLSIFSHLYWSSILDKYKNKEKIIIPEIILKKFENFKKNYSNLKKGRGLTFISNLGLVKLKINLNKKDYFFDVTPDKATAILLFDNQQNALSVDYVSKTLKISFYFASECIDFWVKKNVLIEVSENTFMVNEKVDIVGS